MITDHSAILYLIKRTRCANKIKKKKMFETIRMIPKSVQNNTTNDARLPSIWRVHTNMWRDIWKVLSKF